MKCTSLYFNDNKFDRKSSFQLTSGNTQSLSNNPCKVLGHVVSTVPSSARKASTTHLQEKLMKAINAIESRPIHNEYKLWILKHFVAPSINFLLCVDVFSAANIISIQKSITRALKKWLNLPRSCTLAALFHPEVLKLPFLPHMHELAKASYVCSIAASSDPHIQELVCLLSDPDFRNQNGIPQSSFEALLAAKSSVSLIGTSAYSKSLKSRSKTFIHQDRSNKWDEALDSLSVQSKFKNIVELESSNRVWNHILLGLPAGQLSFLIRAGADCLPTPLNLKRWKFKVESKCSLCQNPFSTTFHILIGCSTSLEQGRFTWRHDSVLLHLTQYLRRKCPPSISIYADLNGWRATESPPATLPPDLSVSSCRPDLVITANDSVYILELTILANSLESLNNSQVRKTQKLSYGILLGDLEQRGIKVSYQTLEIGSLGHYISSNASKSLLGLPCTDKPSIKLLLAALSKIAISCSFNIFNAHKFTDWNPNRSLYSI